jgi:CPA2 family monovalent cation:H+ antiporter-2
MNGLPLVLLLLVAAVLGVVAFRRMNLPPILGYIVVGLLIGPHALALAPDTPATRYLAEFGVVFLMFSIGLEFSLPKLKAMRLQVFGIGASQVGLTMLGGLALASGVGLFVSWLGLSFWTLSWQGALALSGALAMSSTAIVSKMLSERLEIDKPHGKVIMGALLFQDIAVVPLLILVPALARDTANLPMALFLALIKAVTLLALLLVFWSATDAPLVLFCS